MGSNGAGDSSVAAMAEPQYVTAKTSVWWDIENCQVPKQCNANAIAQNISSALANINYCGPVSIHCYGDTTRIASAAQHALSSTGISLNHVPAGVKDASDKKILVDMLLWAIDNPAPANFLLISGDRDFSNALHQLRMRKYTILLAQPYKASAPLVAAAKSVWLWKSLVEGDPPLQDGTSLQLSDTDSNITSSDSPLQVSDSIPITNQSTSSFSQSSFFANQTTENNPKQTKKNINQPPNLLGSTSNVSIGIQGDSNTSSSYQTRVYMDGKQPIDMQHAYNFSNSSITPASNLFPRNSNPFMIMGNPVPTNYQNHQLNFSRPTRFPISAPPNSNYYATQHLPPRSCVPSFTRPLTHFPNISNLNISQQPHTIRATRSSPNLKQRIEGVSKQNPISSLSNNSSQQNSPSNSYDPCTSTNYSHPPELVSSSPTNIVNSNVVWGTPGYPHPPDHVQGDIGVVLIALDTLKNEKMKPDVENITDCVRYGVLGHKNTDVKKALASAMELQMVLKHRLGNDVEFYAKKNESLWKCVDSSSGALSYYDDVVWNQTEKFVASAAGRSALMASRSRYEAAMMLKNTCLDGLALGNVLQILNMIIKLKKWIVPHQSGWQPITILLAETPAGDSLTHQ